MQTPRGNAYPFHRVAERVFNTPLMIHPGRAKIICNYLASRMGLPSLDIDVDYEQPRRSRAQTEPGSIAIIPVHGTLVHRSSFMAAMSGLTSYEDVTQAFRDAVADADVSAILLDVDTGGGEVAGCFALSDEIYAARGVKPIWGIANEHAYSAGYATISAAERVFLTKTSGVGSIGVVSIHMDVSQADAKDGVTYTPIYAGARKIDGWSHAPLTEEAKADDQAEIDRLYGLFCATVGRNRAGKMSEEAARNTEAGCFYGDEAVKLGLADQIGTIDDALSLLAAEIDRSAGSSRGMSVARSRNAMNKEISMATNTAADKPSAAQDEFAPCADCSSPDECRAAGSCKKKDGTMEAATLGAEAPVVASIADVHGAALADAQAKAEAAGYAKGFEAGKAEGKTEGAKEARAEASEIAAHCAAAGMPNVAADAIGKGLNMDAVRIITNASAVAQAQASEVSSAHGGGQDEFTITREAAKDPVKYRQVRDAAMARGKLPTIVD